MAQYKFVIKGIYYNKNRTFPDLNDYLHECGRHPQLGGKLKRDYQMVAVNAIRKQLGKVKTEKPIQIHYAFYEADMRRDKGNIFSFADKVIEDALQMAGFIKNDNWVWIDRILSPDFYVDNDNPRIEVTLTEVDWGYDMAEKRMFAKQIIDSDAFLDMPLSTQALYFHLSMRADDDGFVDNPKKIQRMIGASTDDLKLLIAKRYVLTFESGVIVIKHWRMHNTLRSDRYKPTVYQEEMSTLAIKGNKSYTEAERLAEIEGGKPTGNQPATQIRLDKNSIDKNKDIVGETPAVPPYKEIIDYLNEKTNSHYRHTTKATQRLINGRLSDNFTVEDFKKVIDIKADQWLGDQKMSAFLRPETLFAASHFESYLNEARVAVKESKYPGISEKMAKETEKNIVSGDNYDSGEFQ